MRIYNDPADFKTESMRGFGVAFDRYVERIANASGFLRVGGPTAGKVSLVVGGGSGHYPSYGGVVGRGFADACVLGDVFASPSTEQICRVVRAADGGAGVVLGFGNYAGDRLNFGAAQQRLRAEGIDTRIVYVTDDVASAPLNEIGQRRGIAGTFMVYKAGGAAGDAGADVGEVERIMRKANDATYSFGVAFGGCTLPGKTEPLFAVEENRMELGLGIHGEAGVRSSEWMPGSELANVLVDAVLEERPQEAGNRVAVLVNGLGATTFEELFLLYGFVHDRFERESLKPVLPEIGTMVSSLDMAGCSLSIMWLDEELEEYWAAPADSVSFRRGFVEPPSARLQRVGTGESAIARESSSSRPATAASVAAASVARTSLEAALRVLEGNEGELGRLDAVAGDGDHGAGMVRGMRAATAAAKTATGGVDAVLAAAASAFGDKAGGTSRRALGHFLGNHR